MNTDKDSLLSSLFNDRDDSEHCELNRISELTIGCSFKVGNALGCGFLEKVYENAMVIELRNAGLSVAQQQKVSVFYEGLVVGDYEADLVVNGRVIIELKSVRDLNQVHRAQCFNYLRATGLKLCLLINFGNPRVEIKRIVL
jgi:GxxExxY protein